MRIDHIALWTDDLDRLTMFYATYFGATVGPQYTNVAKGFTSRFLTFADGARVEAMHTTTLPLERATAGAQRAGLTHFAMAAGSEDGVRALTDRLRGDGHPVIDGPRRTGDGYYESVVLDPDGNRVEITA
jgi:lactoylglutathione lyase